MFEPDSPPLEELTLPAVPLEKRVRAVIEKVRLGFVRPDEATRQIVEFLQEEREN